MQSGSPGEVCRTKSKADLVTQVLLWLANCTAHLLHRAARVKLSSCTATARLPGVQPARGLPESRPFRSLCHSSSRSPGSGQGSALDVCRSATPTTLRLFDWLKLEVRPQSIFITLDSGSSIENGLPCSLLPVLQEHRRHIGRVRDQRSESGMFPHLRVTRSRSAMPFPDGTHPPRRRTSTCRCIS